MEIYELFNRGKGIELESIQHFDAYDMSTIDSYMPVLNLYYNASILANENLWVVAVKYSGEVIGVYKCCIGNTQHTDVDYKPIFTFCILTDCYGFYLMHNHPNEKKVEFSMSDIRCNEEIDQLAIQLGFKYYGGIVITEDEWGIRQNDGKISRYKWNDEDDDGSLERVLEDYYESQV